MTVDATHTLLNSHSPVINRPLVLKSLGHSGCDPGGKIKLLSGDKWAGCCSPSPMSILRFPDSSFTRFIAASSVHLCSSGNILKSMFVLGGRVVYEDEILKAVIASNYFFE